MTLTNVYPPSTGNSVVTRDYVDSAVIGYGIKAACQCTTYNIGNIILSGYPPLDPSSNIPSIDGFTDFSNNFTRVLVTDQTNSVQNGIYVVNFFGDWPRSTDLSNNSIAENVFVFVQSGNVYSKTSFLQNPPGQQVIVNSGALNFSPYYKFQVSLGTNLNFNDGILDVNSGLIEIESIQFTNDLTHSQVDPFLEINNISYGTTYTNASITFNKWGQITYAENGANGDPTYWASNDGGATIYNKTISGKVGIGTTTPDYPLDVSGNMRVDNLDPSNNSLNVTSGVLGQTAGNTSLISSYYTHNGDATYINTYAYRYANGTDWTTASTVIQSKIDDGPSALKSIIEFNPQGYTGGIAITNSSRVGLKINDTGNAFCTGGLTLSGTTSTSGYALDITGNVNITGTINGSVSNATNAANILYGSPGNLLYQSGSGTTTFVSNGSTDQILTFNGSIPVWKDPETVTTPTLAAVLSAGSTASTNIDMSYNEITNVGAIYTADSTATCRIISSGGINYIESGTNSSDGTKAPLYFTSMSGVDTWMTIDSSGNVGIGTIAPSKKLEVSGGDALINGLTVGRGGGQNAQNAQNALNTAFGNGALVNNISGYNNVAIGLSAGDNSITGAINSTFIGAYSCSNSNCDNSTAIGCNAVVTSNDQIMLGGFNNSNNKYPNVYVPGTLSVVGATSFSGTLGVTGATTLSGGLGVTGLTTLAALSASGNTSLSGTLDVSGNTTLGNQLKVYSSSTTEYQGAFTYGNSINEGTLLSANGTITEIKMNNLNNSGPAHFTISNDGSFNIIDTGSNTSPYTSGTNLMCIKNNAESGKVGIGTTNPTKKLDVNGTLGVSGNTTLSGTLDVSGNNATTLRGTLGVSGNTTLSSMLDVSGNTTLFGTLDVSGNTTLSSMLDVSGNTNLFGTLDVSGNTTLTGTLGVTGATTLSGELTLSTGSDLTVSGGDTSLTGGLTVYTGDTTLGGTLGVSGNTSLSGTLDVSGNNATTLGGTLDVSGNTTLFGTLDVSGNTTLGGTLDVSGNTTLGGNLTVNGNQTLLNNIFSVSTTGTGSISVQITKDDMTLTSVYPPPTGNSVVTKQYVDSVINGYEVKQACQCATYNIGNINLSGNPGNIDGYNTFVSGTTRVLVTDQTITKDNGIYVVNTTGLWNRSYDLSNNTLAKNVLVFVQFGNDNGKTSFLQDPSSNPITVGTDPLIFSVFNQFDLTVGDNLTFTNGTLSLDSALTDIASIQFTGNANPQTVPFLPTSVTPGDYTNANITVNSSGLITVVSSGSAGDSSYWTSSSSGIYNNNSSNNGNVGIGTGANTLTKKLTVNGDASISTALDVGTTLNVGTKINVGDTTKYVEILPPNTSGYLIGNSTYGGRILAGSTDTSGLWIQSAAGCTITDVGGSGASPSNLNISNGSVNITNKTSANNSLSLTSGTLGQTAGNTSLLSSYTTFITDNNTYINTYAYRYATGTGWDTTASTVIQSVIDFTSKAMIEFNPQGYAGGIAITNSSRVGLKINQAGNAFCTGGLTLSGTTSLGYTLDVSGDMRVTGGSITGTINGYALLASPTFTGIPTAPTASNTDNSIQIATTAFVKNLGYATTSALTSYALLASPTFTGIPTAPTASNTDNSIQIATTAFVKNLGYATTSALTSYALLASPTFTGIPTAPTASNTDNSIQIATTAFVKNLGYATTSALTSYALLASPNFSGIPTAPTAANTDNSIQIATTAFVKSAVSSSSYWSLSGTNIYNNNNGNVGIGTNNPQNKLDVSGNMRVTGGIIGDLSGNATNANNVNISNTATGATNYVLLSAGSSGNQQVLTDNSGLTYDSNTNTLVANITGSATSAPMPFVPKFNNASWFLNGTTGNTQTMKIEFTGTWNAVDFIVFRVNAVMLWGGTYPTATWTSFGRVQGTLQIRPAAMPTSTWSSISSPSLNWALNTPASQTGIANICFFWNDNNANSGNVDRFFVYGENKRYTFMFTSPGVPWYSGMSIEYLYSFSSGGGTHTILTQTVSGNGFTGYNNSLIN